MFKLLSKINRIVLPSMIYKDLTKLSKFEQLIVGYRLWVTKRVLK